MNGADLLEDTVAHGTTAGYEAGCRSLGGCPGKNGRWAQTCSTAWSRSRMEFGYSKAVANGGEVELLEREAAERAAPPAVAPKVARAKRAQEKQHGVPVPVARPRPPAPTPLAAELQQWPDDEAPQPAGSLAKSQGAFASHPKQRDHALATASEEHPMGLTLAGEPRKRCAPGTVLVHGVLQATSEWRTESPTMPIPVVQEKPAVEPELVEGPVVDEEPRPRGKRVLDDALRTLAEAAEMQRAIAEITERALRTARIEINHMRREAAALENQQEK